MSSGVKFNAGLEEYDITIRTDELDDDKETKNMEDLKMMGVESATESKHELQELSSLTFSTGMWGISRVNQEKEINVTYAFYKEYNSDRDLLEGANNQVDEMIASLKIPSGIAIEKVLREDSLEEYKFLIIASAVLIFMILASIFESLVTPFVLMFSIPLAAIGAFLLLLLTGNSFLNPNALTGLLILIGVVVNNSIILIDYSNILRNRGYNKVRALYVAGMARVRPILITAITTVAAMLPLALGDSEYVALIGAPFALTVIGGLTLSTVLTLVFIPTLNTGLENALEWLRSLHWKIKTAQIVAFALGIWLVIEHIDSDLWRSIYMFLLLVGIPGLTGFLINSLKQANEEIIPHEEEIVIEIRNLVKIYGRPNRFQRDIEGNQIRAEKLNEGPTYTKLKDFGMLLWELPLVVVLFYYTYAYLQNWFWVFFFSVICFAVANRIISTLALFRAFITEKEIVNKIGKVLGNFFFWGFPALNAVILWVLWDNYALPIILFVLWMMAIAIYSAAQRLKKTDLNPEALKGRLRRVFYGLVYKMPAIGKKKEPFKALKGVSLEIEKGMFGLLGPNGAGKTTLMRIICGIFEQSYGQITVNGLDTREHREELQGLIGYLPQEFGMYENMSPDEYLNYQAILKGIIDKKTRDERIKIVLESVNMWEKKDEKIGSFSGGMKQRIGIAQILLHLPRILVVDEPTAGLDPRERIRFRNLLVELSKERIVIFSTHIIEDIASSCKKVALMNRGELKYIGTPSEMAKIVEGKVWQFNIHPDQFEEISKKYVIVHHMSDGKNIRVRCLAAKKPAEDAIKVNPILEDAYLWLMKDTGQVLSKIVETE